MPRQVEFLRKLPQQFALTGMRSRTPIYEQYGRRGPTGIPSIGSLAQAPITPQIQPQKIMPGVLNVPSFSEQGGGPGIGPGEGDVGGFSGEIGGGSESSGLSSQIGNNIAGSLAGRGTKGGLMTGFMANQLDVPTSIAVPAVAKSAVLSALAPFSLANIISGQMISGQTAFNAAQAAPSLSANMADVTAQAALANSPSTLSGHISAMLGGQPTAGEASAAAVNAATQGAQSMTGIAQSSQDPTASMLGRSSPSLTSATASSLGAGPSASMMGEPGGAGNIGGVTGSVGSGAGGGGGTVICTELHRQGLMSDEIYEADSKYGDKLPREVLEGYYTFGKPLARLMAKSKIITAIIKPLALSWANQMAHVEGVIPQSNRAGAFIEFVGIPLCKLISRVSRRRFLESQPIQE